MADKKRIEPAKPGTDQQTGKPLSRVTEKRSLSQRMRRRLLRVR